MFIKKIINVLLKIGGISLAIILLAIFIERYLGFRDQNSLKLYEKSFKGILFAVVGMFIILCVLVKKITGKDLKAEPIGIRVLLFWCICGIIGWNIGVALIVLLVLLKEVFGVLLFPENNIEMLKGMISLGILTAVGICIYLLCRRVKNSPTQN